MTNKTRVLHVRVVGFSAPERQMLNSIFLLSVAPARQIGYKLWNAENGTAPDMYLLDGDSESAVASWQAAFTNTADRTLVVGSKNTDLGVASAARPLGLKVVSAMDRLAIALHNAALKIARENAAQNAGLDVSAPSANGTLPTSPAASTMTSAAVPPPVLSASINASLSSLSNTISPNAQTLSATYSAALPATHAGTLPPAMTATPPAATVLPNVTLQPNVPLSDKVLEKTINEKSLVEKPALEKPAVDKPVIDKHVTEKAVDRILSEKPLIDRAAVPKMDIEKTAAEKISAAAASLMASGVTPLSPAALSAVVGTSTSTSTSGSSGSSTSSTRTNLRVVPSVSPMAASLPGASSTMSRIADAPMSPPPVTSRIADAPMVPPPSVPMAAPVSVTFAPASPVAPVAPAAATPMVAAPVAAAPAVAPTTPPAYTPNAPTARHEEQMFRVLAVDDSPLMRTFLQNKLAPYGIQPDFAASGEEALFKISKQHFDMIFLDVMLPGMDGYDVCKMIKKNKDNHLMKVVMLTSKDKTFDKIRGTMAGCDGYLTKPVDELKLRSIIERHTVTRK